MKSPISVLVVGCLLSACGSDVPSVSEARKIYENKYESSKCLKVSKFDKTNGQKQEVAGVALYVMEYKSEVEFIAPCYAVYNEKQKNFDYGPLIESRDNFLFGKSKLFNIGDKVEVVGKITLQKKENGWSK